MKKKREETPSTSWERASHWYHKTVGHGGHTDHQTIILPQLLPLLDLQQGDSLLDLGCGQGVLARAIPSAISYWGMDLSPSLIREAKKSDRNPKHHYLVGDATQSPQLAEKSFSHAVFLLSLQNMESPGPALLFAGQHLRQGGKLFLVLNHPCFRIPRQSSWEVDQKKKVQFRRMDLYASPLKIPIATHPSRGEEGGTTWSFHYPLSSYFGWLKEAGLAVTNLHEWYSPKESEGAKAKMENRARKEFPLYCLIEAVL